MNDKNAADDTLETLKEMFQGHSNGLSPAETEKVLGQIIKVLEDLNAYTPVPRREGGFLR
jgi:hypothetical protein